MEWKSWNHIAQHELDQWNKNTTKHVQGAIYKKLYELFHFYCRAMDTDSKFWSIQIVIRCG